MQKVVFLILLLLVHRHVSWAAPVKVQTHLSASTIYLGEQVQLEVRIVGVRDPVLPDMQHPDIDITRQGGQSFSNTSISTINGQTTRVETVGYVARYQLRPRLDGTLHLPAVAITHAGKTYQSQPLTLVVRTPAEQDFLLVEVYTDKAHYTLGERVTVTLDVSLRQLTIDGKELDINPFFTEAPPHLQIPWAVGRFQLAVTASPTALKVGDPLSLTITVQQQADSLLETVHPLRLEDQTVLARDFKLHTDPPAVQTDDHAKSFTYTVRPRHRDVHEVPPIAFTYYDPEAAAFRELRSHPIPIQVEGADILDVSEVIVASEEHPTSRLGQQLQDGLLANYTGPEVLVQQKAQLHVSPFLGGLVVVPPFLYVALLLGRGWWQRRRQEPGRQRQRKAARVALTELRALSSQTDRHEAAIGEGVHRALAGYLRDKLDLHGAGLTVDDMTRHLRQHGVESALLQQTETLLHRCDSVRYAPGPLVVTELTELIEEAQTLIQRLEASSTP